MRKPAVAGSLAFHASVLLLLLLMGTVAQDSKTLPSAVILLEPLRAPRLPPAHIEGGGGQRSPQPVKRRVFLPPMVAVNERPLVEVGFHLL